MKRLILIAAAPLALAACGGGDDTAEDTTAADTTAMADGGTATADTYVTTDTMGDGQAMAGTYTTTAADGTVSTETINADGTYSVTNAAGEEVVNGTVAFQGGQVCYTSEGQTAAMCFNQTSPAADGSWEQVNAANGERTKVVRN